MHIVVICLILWYLKEYMLSCWLILIYGAYIFIMKDKGLALEYENVISQYYKEQCVVPVKSKFLFPYRSEKYGECVPKQIFLIAVLGLGMNGIGSVFIILGRLSNRTILAVMGFVVIFVWYLVVITGLSCIIYIKCFLWKYKKITKKNVKILLMGRFHDFSEETPVFVGKCKILSTRSVNIRNGQGYAVVQMLEDGEIIPDVIIQADCLNDAQGFIYCMYRICDVFYLQYHDREGG